MKAAVVTRYGPPDVVTVRDMPKPVPKPDEVLVRVHATTVSRTDYGELRPGLMRIFYGLRRPRRKIFGLDFAGEVETAGLRTTIFKPGDRVFGMCPITGSGAHAEYICMAETGPISVMPAILGFDEAVVCEGAYYADAGWKKFKVGPDHKILIYGASGAIGIAALQLAKARGAEVTAVVATHHIDLVRSLGADRGIDYSKEDFTKIGERFDFVFDAVGKASYFRCRRLLKPGGTFLSTDVGPWMQILPLTLWSAVRRSNRVVVALQPRGSAPGFVRFMRGLIEDGKFRAVIDRKYPLDAIAEAYRYVETRQKTGIVVITVADA
jgi:NADPH:quinone reductase-like Zn-dependent oxidoreductase